MLHVRERVFESPHEFKRFCKRLTTKDRKNLIKLAKKQHISWNTDETFKINWMRCAMAISEHLKSGGKFRVPVSENLDVLDTFPKKEMKQKPTEAVSNLITEGLNVNQSNELQFRETPEGDLIFGEGFKAEETKIGFKPLPGYARIFSVKNHERLNTVCAVLECARQDREIVVKMLNGRYDPVRKCYYIPLSLVINAIQLIKNIEVTKDVAPIIKKVLEIRTFLEESG